ncbi:MAG: glycosyltransferase family A protein [Prolixibacteraceae bacterium]|jgi:glycosyltransferase involved in cell wall biosynthesis|nr:glycosyltransferase family A protein [Prolixibacteraceae bacterium]
MNKPDITVVIPAFNREKTIKRAIESVINQTFDNWELIIVDDCSTDRTVQLIQDFYSYDCRVKVEKLEINGGANMARNQGARIARAPLIIFFDSDDELAPTTLKNHLGKFADNHELGLSYVFATCIKNGEIVATFNQKVNANAERILFMGFHGIGSATSGLCIRKDVFDEIGGFDELMPSHQDLDFIVRVAGNYSIDYIENSNTLMYWDEQNRISDNPMAVINGAAYFFAKHEKRLKELDIYHHVARKLTRKYALFGKNMKYAYRILGKAIAFKPFYFYAYVYAFKIPLLYRRKID